MCANNKRVPRGILLAALLAVLCSCGAQPAARDDAPTAPREAGTREAASAEETAAQNGASEEAARPKTGSSDGEDTEPALRKSAVVEKPEPEDGFRDGPASASTAARPAVGTNGMVSAAHPLATEAGLEILADGGNAFDAAVAVGAALNAVEPMMSGVGGYGATVVYDAEEGETRFLETGSRTPETLDPSVFRPPTPGYQENRCGGPVVSTPGNLEAWETMWEEYGELEWSRLFGPAIRYAEEGFVVSEETAGWIGSEYSAFPEHAQAIYGNDGAPLTAGDRLVQRDLAGSLRLIAREGAGAVYAGELGKAMVSEAQQNGGFLTVEDLRKNRATWRGTISADHRNYEVVTAAPPSTAWGSLVRLGTMSEFGMVPSDHNGTQYVHALTEVSKNAFSQTRRYAADPPLDRLLSENFLAREAAKVDFSGVAPFEPPTTFDSAVTCSPTGYVPTTAPDTGATSASASASASAGAQQGHTTHFAVADREGNVVSSTQTLGNVFGSKLMPEGTGIWLNDQLAWSRFEPAGNVFDVFPGRQSLYALCPTIVTRDGRPIIALGTPGGRTIPQTTTQMLVNLTDFDMDVQQAISAPRFSFVIPDLLGVEPGIPAPVRAELEALGHSVYVDEYGFGNAHGLTIEYGRDGDPTRFTGGADPRGEGAAEGF